MKIISKYKDYYDYLQGIYGIDEKLILDRRESQHPAYYYEGRHLFTIGNIYVDVLFLNGKFYCGESDMIKLNGEKSENKSITSYEITFKDYCGKICYANIATTPYGKNRVNKNFDKYAIYLHVNNKAIPYPRLEQYGIQKVLSPHDIWIELSDWLSQQLTKKEPSVPVGDDKVRILSAGFDLKTSFRK